MTSKAIQPDLTVVGDVMPGRKVARSLQRVGFGKAAASLRGLLTGRVVVGNLECVLSDAGMDAPRKPDGGPALCAPSSAAVWLREAGFHVLSLANNHAMDGGPRGLASTIRSLRRAGVRTLGAGGDLAEALAPLVLPCGSRQVALLAFGNGPPAGRDSPGVAPLNSDALARALGRVPRTADATVVLVHAGLEFLECPESWLRRFAAEALAGGADLVIGSHPHCLRGVHRGEQGVVLYSLGDFLMDTADRDLLNEHLTRTAITRLGFAPTGALHCREGLVADIRLNGTGTPDCALRPVVLNDDFLPRAPGGQERGDLLERVRLLSETLRDPRSEEMRRARRIEKAYRASFGGRRKVTSWLALPFRLARRGAVRFLRPIARSRPGAARAR
ncbi:MAG TPA: CapA family protein [Phycisphaerae bacterium]|nr:CapA family protein [Phycisphaerae bacterium]